MWLQESNRMSGEGAYLMEDGRMEEVRVRMQYSIGWGFNEVR